MVRREEGLSRRRSLTDQHGNTELVSEPLSVVQDRLSINRWLCGEPAALEHTGPPGRTFHISPIHNKRQFNRQNLFWCSGLGPPRSANRKDIEAMNVVPVVFADGPLFKRLGDLNKVSGEGPPGIPKSASEVSRQVLAIIRLVQSAFDVA